MIFIDHSQGMKAPEAPVHKIEPTSLLSTDGSLMVDIDRAPWDDFFKLTLPNGHTEELDPEETLAWFKTHGTTDVNKLERALDYVWNFATGSFRIPNPVDPDKLLKPGDPKL